MPCGAQGAGCIQPSRLPPHPCQLPRAAPVKLQPRASRAARQGRLFQLRAPPPPAWPSQGGDAHRRPSRAPPEFGLHRPGSGTPRAEPERSPAHLQCLSLPGELSVGGQPLGCALCERMREPVPRPGVSLVGTPDPALLPPPGLMSQNELLFLINLCCRGPAASAGLMILLTRCTGRSIHSLGATCPCQLLCSCKHDSHCRPCRAGSWEERRQVCGGGGAGQQAGGQRSSPQLSL